MKLSQSWVGYLDRSYQQIKNSLLARFVINNPEITDHNESNLLIVIMSMFSGMGEMINYYIDMMGREGFLGVAKRYTSVVRLVRIIDYNVKAKTIATVNELFALVNNDGSPYYTTAIITIPKGTQISDINGTVFNTIDDAQIIPGQAGVFSTAGQWTDKTAAIGNTDGTPMQQLLVDADYVDSSMSATVDGTPWVLYTSMGLMREDTQGFIIQVQEDGNCYLIFGDGVNGLIPDAGLPVVGTYQICNGVNGNLPPDSINNLSSSITIPAGVTLTATNPDYSSGGNDFQGIEDVRNKAPRQIRTLERAVTYQDYIDVAILCPGVGDAAVAYCCGKYVTVYIAPSSQGVATNALIARVTDWFKTRKMITTKVSIIAAGISRLFVDAQITAKPLYTSNQVLVEVINLLYAKYGFEFAEINSNVSVSDIIFVMESGKSVDHVDIASVRVVPYVKPVQGTTIPLLIDFKTYPATNTQYTYTIIYKATSSQFKIYRGGNPVGSVGLEQTFNDGIVSFIIHSASYTDGSQWQFVNVPSYPEIFPNTQMVINDYTIPILDIGPLVNADVPRTIFSNLTVVTQGVNSNCLPTCP